MIPGSWRKSAGSWIGPQGELYGRYKTYPTAEQIPLYALVHETKGVPWTFGQEQTKPEFKETSKAEVFFGVLALSSALGAAISPIAALITREKITGRTFAHGALFGAGFFLGTLILGTRKL